MKLAEFNKIVDYSVDKIKKTLVKKGNEYALNSDRLENFRCGAGLSDQTETQVLFGYMLKHIVSITNMIQSGNQFSEEQWYEKTGDIINYLILMRGTIVDDKLITEKEGK